LIPLYDWPRTLPSQFATSPTLDQLVENFNTWVDPAYNFEQFYQYVWNIDYAYANDSTYGLDVWGRIVGIGRVVSLEGGSFFGFQEAGDRTGFNQSPFWNGIPITTNFTLTNEAYYNLILAKAASNITNGSIPAINSILLALFPGRGNAYVTDGGNSQAGIWFGFQEAGDRTGFNQGPFSDYAPSLPANMTLTYVFDFPLEPFEMAIVKSGVLPKGAGVRASVVINVPNTHSGQLNETWRQWPLTATGTTP
jgi:hypothetical protein